jgi:hypothetical protein
MFLGLIYIIKYFLHTAKIDYCSKMFTINQYPTTTRAPECYDAISELKILLLYCKKGDGIELLEAV